MKRAARRSVPGAVMAAVQDAAQHAIEQAEVMRLSLADGAGHAHGADLNGFMTGGASQIYW